MLYAPLGQGRPRRIQSCFITDEEVQAVVSFIKDREEGAVYAQDVMDEIDKRADAERQGWPRRISSLRRAGRRALSG